MGLSPRVRGNRVLSADPVEPWRTGLSPRVRGNPLAYFPAVGNLAPVQAIVTRHAQRSTVGRDIEPARRARNYVMALQFFFAATALAAPAITSQDGGP